MTVILRSLDDTQALAGRIAPYLRKGDVVALSGTLGAGKTTFVQFLVAALSKTPVEVTSPTFTLLSTYPVTLADGTSCDLHHYDLYRIDQPGALTELGMEEAFEQLAVIEWPEKLVDTRPVTLALTFHLAKDGTREVRMESFGALKQRMAA